MNKQVDIFRFASDNFDFNEFLKLEEQEYPCEDFDILNNYENEGF